jgi:hypothetical protein
MMALKIFAALAASGAAICWAVFSHRETERQRAIVNDVRHLPENCGSRHGSEAIKIHGRVLVWEIKSNHRSGVHRKIPGHLKEYSSSDQVTVFMIMGERDVKVGTYSISGQPAYRRYLDICVAYWPEKKIAGMGSVVSQEPRFSRPVKNQPEYGDPNAPIAAWIARLSRNETN